MGPTAGSYPDIKNNAHESPDRPDGRTAVVAARRRFLSIATAALGIVGAGFAAVPLLRSLRPSARAQARGGPIKVDISRLEPGEQITVIWRGRPVWVLRRTAEILDRMSHEHWLERLRDPNSSVESQQPAYARNATRSIRPDVFVAVALCTHLGCVPNIRPEAGDPALGEDWMGGYFCPCHGSLFDFAGRVTRNVPAPVNLVIPPHRFLGPDTVEIGVDNA